MANLDTASVQVPALIGVRGQAQYTCNFCNLAARPVLMVFKWCSAQGEASKSLKRWSGRRDSNPRRPAWEIDRRLIIQNLASIRSIADDPKQLILRGADFTRLVMDFYWTLSFLWPEGCDDHFCQLLSPLN